MLLANLFNSTITEGILLHIFHYDEIHASAIARYLGKSLTGVLTQLDQAHTRLTVAIQTVNFDYAARNMPTRND